MRVACGWVAPPNDRDDLIQVARIAGAKAYAYHECPSDALLFSYMRYALGREWHKARAKKRIPASTVLPLSFAVGMGIGDPEPSLDLAPSRKGRPWTDEEDEFLQQHRRLGGRYCAQRLGRTERAVYERLSALGLADRGNHPAKHGATIERILSRGLAVLCGAVGLPPSTVLSRMSRLYRAGRIDADALD